MTQYKPAKRDINYRKAKNNRRRDYFLESDRWLREHSSYSYTCRLCGKLSFRSKTDAKKAAERTNPGADCHTYKCDGLYHWTSGSAVRSAQIRTRKKPGYVAASDRISNDWQGWSEPVAEDKYADLAEEYDEDER